MNWTDPSGFYVWYNRTGENFSWQHKVVEDWFERTFGSFWQTHHEFNQISRGSGRKRPDILHFPYVVPSNSCGPNSSPIDFGKIGGVQGEIYEIEPVRIYPYGGGGPLQTLIDGEKEAFIYYGLLNFSGWRGNLQDTFKETTDREGVPHNFVGTRWNLTTVRWKLGGTMPLGRFYSVPAGGQTLLVISPVPGLILYVDNVTRQQVETATGIVSAFALRNYIRGLAGKAFGGSLTPGALQPRPAGPSLLIIPGFLLDPMHPYNPANPSNCWKHPEFCTTQKL